MSRADKNGQRRYGAFRTLSKIVLSGMAVILMISPFALGQEMRHDSNKQILEDLGIVDITVPLWFADEYKGTLGNCPVTVQTSGETIWLKLDGEDFTKVYVDEMPTIDENEIFVHCF